MNVIATAGASDYDISLNRNVLADDLIDDKFIVHAFNCSGTFGTLGSFGSATGCAATAGTYGSFGCGGGGDTQPPSPPPPVWI